MRREVYGDDFGQASWITRDEAQEWFDLLQLGRDERALEIACGSGGLTCMLAARTRASCTGVDINPSGIEAARRRADEGGLGSRVRFSVIDAGAQLPFDDGSFDAAISNDSINHLPDRPSVFADWKRVLRPGGAVLFTDPIVVTGQLTSDEIRRRSSIGYFVFTPLGYNEEALKESGFDTLDVRDVTGPVVEVSRRWVKARERRRTELIAIEGEDRFASFQEFLDAVHTLALERRLSRYRYFARRRHGA